MGVCIIVARKRRKWFRKASDDPKLGSAATGSNDGLLPSDQPANSKPSSREPYDPLTWAQLNGIPVPNVDSSKRRSSRPRRSRLVMIHTSLEPIPEHEQWEFCSCSNDDDTSPLPESFHAWYQNRRHRLSSTRVPITARHTKNPVEEPPASPSSEGEGATGLRDIVNLSSRHARGVHMTSRALEQERGPTRHHDTGPRDSSNIDKRSTHLVQFLAPILLQEETKPSVTAQHADSAAISATARAA